MNENGYTLIETLITLSLLSVLTLLPILTFSNFREHHEANYVSWQLKEDYLLAQHTAMARGESVSLRSTSSSYHIRLLNGSKYLERQFSTADMLITPISLTGNYVSFNRNGNPRYAGTILLRTHKREFIYVLHLGKGRIRYSEI
ncbi:competence type IV pilus minor pilin ComGD [Alkalicoccobacillus plakortidis]|uniref:competence type IV pilus minor pilin ComGD n=1 Tax=Alkalicoccobacillus plakortidis TaxID=444060 RepID=UPI00358DACAC